MRSALMSWLDKLPLIVLREDFFLVNSRPHPPHFPSKSQRRNQNDDPGLSNPLWEQYRIWNEKSPASEIKESWNVKEN